MSWGFPLARVYERIELVRQRTGETDAETRSKDADTRVEDGQKGHAV